MPHTSQITDLSKMTCIAAGTQCTVHLSGTSQCCWAANTQRCEADNKHPPEPKELHVSVFFPSTPLNTRVPTLLLPKIPGLFQDPRTFFKDTVAAQQHLHVKTNGDYFLKIYIVAVQSMITLQNIRYKFKRKHYKLKRKCQICHLATRQSGMQFSSFSV